MKHTIIVNEDITRVFFTAKEVMGNLEYCLLEGHLEDAAKQAKELGAFVGILRVYIGEAAKKSGR